MKRWICLLLAALLLLTPAMALEQPTDEELKISAPSAILMERSTGTVLYEKNADEHLSPASVTKIMTLLLIMEQLDSGQLSTDTVVTASANACAMGGSQIWLREGEQMTVDEMIKCIAVSSANDCAVAMAEHICGSESAFTKRMNERAQALGMENTHFSNAHGLWAQQNYSSCKDMATLCEYAISKYQVFRDIVCLPSYHMASTSYHSDGTDIYNTNLMLDSMTDYYYSYAKGIKTGTLDSAGRCLASYAEYEGTTYLIVTMGAPMDKLKEDVKKGEEDPDSIYGGDNVYYNLLDHISLYKWAFSSLVATDFVDKNSEVRDVKVSYGDGIDYANLKPANGFTRLWPVDISVNDVEKKITVYDNVVAPVEVGDVLGKMELVYKGEVLATIDLVSTTKVERSQVKAKVKIAKSYFESSVFKVTLTILIALIVIYSVIHIAKIQKKYMK